VVLGGPKEAIDSVYTVERRYLSRYQERVREELIEDVAPQRHEISVQIEAPVTMDYLNAGDVSYHRHLIVRAFLVELQQCVQYIVCLWKILTSKVFLGPQEVLVIRMSLTHPLH
jgi:hypothetical protein